MTTGKTIALTRWTFVGYKWDLWKHPNIKKRKEKREARILIVRALLSTRPLWRQSRVGSSGCCRAGLDQGLSQWPALRDPASCETSSQASPCLWWEAHVSFVLAHTPLLSVSGLSSRKDATGSTCLAGWSEEKANVTTVYYVCYGFLKDSFHSLHHFKVVFLFF